MGKLGNKREMDRRSDDGDHNGGEEEQLALTPSRPSKRQKKLLISANDILILPTKLCDWLRHKFISPLLFTLPSPFPAPSSSSSSSDLIAFNNNSSSASGPGSSKYDVFISFRGADVRNNFLSHLYYHLHNLQKLAVYKDDVDLERGEPISPSLLLAIRRSDVYIVILSPKYTDSPWCLEELEEMLRCMKLYGRKVIPVFYGVDPSEVENQELPSASAGRIRRWRAALSEVANRSGCDSQVIRSETELIEEITKAVFQALRYSCSQMVKVSAYSASRRLVGIETRIEQLQALLCSDGRSNCTIGLWGMGGIGKTVLAKAFFDLFSCQFEASYFFSNFADTMAKGSSLQPFGNLQSDFFSKLLGDENGRASVTVSYDMALRRLGRMKALVVIDDVGDDVANIGPLKDLLNGQYCDLFGPGSVIIMTSRNKQLLKSVCDHVYKANGLDKEEASRLFCLHAFKGESGQTEYRQMINRAVDYVDGNPLAIMVLGAHLLGRDIKFWDRELCALEDNPNPVVQNVLRRSYDGLSWAEKDIFLDLACFYRYWEFYNLELIELLLGLEGGKVNLITNLADKSLISVQEDRIKLNHLQQDLGRNIVDEERQIEKRSRLWRYEDIYYLFRENKGTESTEAIILDFKHWKNTIEGHDLHLDLEPETLMKMKRLRFLMNYHSNLVLPKGGLKYLPNTLRILHWHSLTCKCLPSQFSAENLVHLYLPNSEIEQLWEGDELNADLGNLTFLSLGRSKRLRKLPNLSTAKKLQTINLPSCESLVELPSSILDLPKLESLDLSHCCSLKLENLEDYANCNGGQSTGHHDILPSLRKLNLSFTPIQKVPNFITRLHILELRCNGCSKLTEFPVVPSLERLELTGSLIEEVVELEKFTELKHLDLSGNKQLVLISGDFCSIDSFIPHALERLLPKLSLNGCKSLATLPDSIGNLMHLESLDLSSTAMKALPSSIGDLIRLSELILQGCKSLACLPDTIHKLTKLKKLVLFGCDQLTHLPELPSSLQELDAYGCKSLQTLSIGTVEKHDFTRIHWCFGQCWKLDPVVCNKLVDKFTKDSVGARRYESPSLLLPAKWGSESGGEEGNKKGPNNGNNNNTVVTAKLRGQPWMLKSLIFCVLLNSLDPLLYNGNYRFRVQCMMLNNKDSAGAEVVVSEYYWESFRKYEDRKEERLLNGDHFLVWSTDEPRGIRENTDDSSTDEFFFRGLYYTPFTFSRSERHEIPDLIKNCQVIPVYNDRLFTNEDGEEETDDDDGECPNHLQGLYNQLCARPPPVKHFTEET